MSIKKDEDTWLICPICNTKLKQERLPVHMKRVHKEKMDDEEMENMEKSYKKRRENKTPRFISKTTIAVITIICVVVVAAILVYFLYYSKGSNDQNDKINYIVSIDGKGDFLSIQEAIDSASENDIIFVNNGNYSENIEIKKSLKLIGEDKNTTIINGNGSGTVINILADYVKLSGFTIKNGGPDALSELLGAGIVIQSNYSTILDCNIASNKNYGLYLFGNPKPTNNIIKFNIFYNNRIGIYANLAKLNTISSNTFTYNTEYGMYLSSASDDNLVSDNIFTENDYAIRIKSSEKNTIIKNQIMNNKYGLYFCCGAINNIAYNNNFINNAEWNAEDGTFGNTWDNGKVGNYWDNYTGTDVNSDGIGDISYRINGNQVDRFPLMKPK